MEVCCAALVICGIFSFVFTEKYQNEGLKPSLLLKLK